MCDPNTWDRSSYSVTSSGGSTNCATNVVTVCNTSPENPATCPVQYEVYRQEPNTAGNPIDDGALVFSGSIPAIGSGCGQIDYSAVVAANGGDGDYMVLVFQHPQHPGLGELRSDQCTVT